MDVILNSLTQRLHALGSRTDLLFTEDFLMCGMMDSGDW